MQAARVLVRTGARHGRPLVSPSPRPLHVSARLFAADPPSSATTDDEKRELQQAKRERDLEAIAQRKLKEAKTPLAKWIRQDATLAERERMKAMADKIRELYPERAQAADDYVNTLDIGVLLQQAQKEFPEFGQKTLSDEDVFDVLKQFLHEGELNPALAKTRARMGEEKQKAEEMKREEVAKLDELRKLLSKDFPDLLNSMADGKLLDIERLPLDERSISQLSEQATQEIFQKLQKPETFEPISREEFFYGVDKTNLTQLREREEKWNKYQEILASARAPKITPAVEDLTVEKEPVIEAAGNFDRLYTPASLGKYIRWNEREQKKFLPEGWCGKLDRREFESTKETSLMLRQESLDAIAKLEQARALSFTRRAPRPILFTGERGVGKSAALQHVVYWARKSGWLVFNIKSGLKWTQSGGIIQKSKILPGHWDQPHLAVTMLTYFLDAHADKLKQIPLRTNPQVGKFEGKTLFDLVEYGAALHEIATEVVVHLRRELTRVIEFPVLIAIDDYNELYNYSQTWRNPETTKFKPEKLQNRALTLTDIFLDVHRDPKLVNGTFIGAISQELTLRHFNLEAERGDNKDWIEVKPYSLAELNYAMEHYKRTKTIYAPTSTGTHEVLHQLTLGNGAQVHKWTVGI